VSGSAKRRHNSHPLTLQTVYALSANSLQHLGPRIRESRTLSRTVILYIVSTCSGVFSLYRLAYYVGGCQASDMRRGDG